MNMQFETRSADKLAFIAWLAAEFGTASELGKKAFQKLVHIAEEGLEVPTGYAFSLYTYGAFSRDLAGDMDIAKSVGGIEVDYIVAENRYVVSPGKRCQDTIDRAQDFFRVSQNKLKFLKQYFCGVSARQLELFSTLLFLLKRRGEEEDNTLVRQLILLKPKYSHEEAVKTLTDVREFLRQAKSVQ